MESIYNSPFTYGPGPYYIPDHNPNYIQTPDYIHPDSIAGQMGLTPEELAPILQEQQELMRDEFAQPLSRLPTPTAHPELKEDAYEGYGMAYDPYPAATSYDDDDIVSNRSDTPQGWHQPQPPTPILLLDARPPLQPPDCEGYSSTSDHGPHASSFEHHEHEGDTTLLEPDRDVTIEQPARELFASGNTRISWAEGMDYIGLQGEYTPTNYSPTPARPLLHHYTHPHPQHRTTSPPVPNTGPPMRGTTPRAPATRPNTARSAPTPAPSARGASLSKNNDVT